ncbi:MAG: topoisomerase DNA-binding C4 zinc finger domain-containing protein, partial [Candidatus Woesearchaeota archaeon]
IGESLAEAIKESEEKKNFIGKCPVCKEGNLRIINNKKNNSRFIACDRYPDCKTIFSIPQNSKLIESTTELCSSCNYPIIEISSSKNKQKICINPKCPSKDNIAFNNNLQLTKIDDSKKSTPIKKNIKDVSSHKDTNKIEENNLTHEKCPLCKEGTIVIRQSIYGKFLACNRFPKCRFTKPLNNTNNQNK